MSALDRVIGHVSKRNFDNDVVGIIARLRRYGKENEPIIAGNSTLEGGIIEFLIAICDEIDELDARIASLAKPAKDTNKEDKKEDAAPSEKKPTAAKKGGK